MFDDQAKRGEKSADQTDKQSTEDGAEKVNDGMSLVGQTVCEICGAVVKCLSECDWVIYFHQPVMCIRLPVDIK
jgi:hypothetical protein